MAKYQFTIWLTPAPKKDKVKTKEKLPFFKKQKGGKKK